MKRTLLAFGLLSVQILGSSAHAEEATPSVTPSTAQQSWESLTPAQQEAAKQYAKQQAQEKGAAYQQLSPEQKQQKRAEFASKFRAHRAAR